MQNRYGCGCQGFVAADSNWDFTMKDGCRQGAAYQKDCECQQTPARQTDNGCCDRPQRRNRTDAPCTADVKCEKSAPRECAGQAEPTCCADTAHTAKNRHVGMISIEKQRLEHLYERDAALKAGTLYPELHKPLNGYCPCGQQCGDDEQALAFTLWELRLYLNTHPCDKEALALFRKLCKEACDDNYATAFLGDCAGGWDWVNCPWPWEYAANCCD